LIVQRALEEFRIQDSGVQEANTDGREQILASNTLLIGWKPMNNQPQAGSPILQLLTSDS
jgi:hypothetical protein